SVTPGSFPMGPKVMERYAPRGGVVMQGTSAEIIANKWDISREDMDAFAVQSHQRAAAATAEGRFDNEIIPVQAKIFDRETSKVTELDEMVTADEGIRPDSSMESLAKLKPAFDPENGRVTAANSSQITDGASAVLIMTEEQAKE